NGSIVNAAGSSKNVTAENLRLQAKNAIGTNLRHISTNITNVSAYADTGSMFITEDDGAVVTTVRTAVTDFNSDAHTTLVTDYAQSGLRTGTAGHVVLAASGGDITLNAGDALVDQEDGDNRSGDNVAASANGTGSILLSAITGSLTGNAD